MLSKIFRKGETPSNTASEQPPQIAAEALLAAQEANQAALKTEWENKLQSAMGNDHALLDVAKQAPLVDIKQAAVMALEGEAALKQAEREFRTHDRRVHRAAKQRYETMLERHKAHDRASQLIESAAILMNEALIPANRLVELDQAWRALDHTLLKGGQTADFTALQAKLTALVRERGDFQRTLQRWTADAAAALAQLNAACAEVLQQTSEYSAMIAALAAASQQVRATLLAAPAGISSKTVKDETAIALLEALRSTLHQATQIEERLAILIELDSTSQPAAPAPEVIPVASADMHADAVAPAPPPKPVAPTPSQRWQALPPISDSKIDKALNARFEEWQRSLLDQRKSRQAEKKQRAKEESKATQQAHLQALQAIVEKAETALTEGHLAEISKHLIEIQEAPGSGSASSALHTRINAVQAGYLRLKGWQQWGGGLAREDLVAEAEELAKASVGEDGQTPPKLPLKQHGEAITKLRTRWKELDRLGGATSRELWQRFDDALKTAYVPVAAHLDKLTNERNENLTARNALLATLDAVNITTAENSAAPDWRAVARELERFQTEWRKLGPVEHTVPHRARDALLEHMRNSVARLENPLHETRRNAQSTREEFITRAKALSADAQSRDVVAKVRALQAEWQQHAKSQPLPRNVENALWTEFKTAIDAIFSQRDAAFSAKDAELKANQATREALIASVSELTQDTPPADIKRTIAAAETEWRKAGEAPRSEAAKLDEKFRKACQTALQHIAGSAQRVWNTTCDALAAKVKLCEEEEANADPIPDIEERWSALPKLPTSWEQALHKRLKGEATPADESLDTLLLQLESTLEMPSPAAFQDARRALKLSVMKNTMEGRDAPTGTKTGIEELTAAALGYARISTVHQERLAAILATLRAGAFEVHGDKIRIRNR